MMMMQVMMAMIKDSETIMIDEDGNDARMMSSHTACAHNGGDNKSNLRMLDLKKGVLWGRQLFLYPSLSIPYDRRDAIYSPSFSHSD